MNYVLVALGSALGGVARYWCSGFAVRLIGEWFPWGTLIVNVVGARSSWVGYILRRSRHAPGTS
jgi:fluoride ion exporter CrcB/FEX